MKVIMLKKNPTVYSCNPYLVLGNWNTLEDINTLVDVGPDGYVIDEIEKINTGVGKKPVEQIVLTHNHFDHTAGLLDVKKKFGPKVYAFNKIEGVDVLLNDGDMIRMGDSYFEIIHVPFHSHESIILYCKSEGIIFTGDTPMNILSTDGSYSREFLELFTRLSRMGIRTIYSGHDDPIVEAEKLLKNSLTNLKISVQKTSHCHMA